MDHQHHHIDHDHLNHSSPTDFDQLFSADDFSMYLIILYSLTVSLHCAGMCGPLLFSQIASQPTRPSKTFLRVCFYHLGRCLSYTSAGAICGFFGSQLKSIASLASSGGAAFSISMGLLLLGVGIAKLRRSSSQLWPVANLRSNHRFGTVTARMMQTVSSALKSFERWIWAIVSSTLTQIPLSLRDFTLGLVTVLLPCMTLTPCLLAAMATASPWLGAQALFAFFLGTVPIMTLSGFAGLIRAPSWIPQRALVAGFMMIAGLVTILRATPWAHWLH
jgi:sulfite exporter TauE/SafE